MTGHGGKMRSGDFPLARRTAIILPRGHHWRVDTLDAKGVAREGLLVIIARFEYHGTHPGWHCHLPCCDVAEIEPAQPLHRQFVRLPKAESRHRRMVFDLTEASALAAAFRFYRVTGTPEGMLI